MIEVYYVNTKGDRLDFYGDNIVINNVEALFDNKWSYVHANSINFGGKIKRFYKAVQEMEFTLTAFCDSEKEFSDLMREVEDIFYYDIYNLSPGRLYINDYYLECYIYQSEYADYADIFYAAEKKFALVTEYPAWTKEYAVHMNGNVPVDNAIAGLATVGDAVVGQQIDFDSIDTYMLNPQDAACAFRIEISGFNSAPSVQIGEIVYGCDITLQTDEKLVIDSKYKTVTYVHADGTEENAFGNRIVEYNIFERIPSGMNRTVFAGKHGLDIMLYLERGEPSWI